MLYLWSLSQAFEKHTAPIRKAVTGQFLHMQRTYLKGYNQKRFILAQSHTTISSNRTYFYLGLSFTSYRQNSQWVYHKRLLLKTQQFYARSNPSGSFFSKPTVMPRKEPQHQKRQAPGWPRGPGPGVAPRLQVTSASVKPTGCTTDECTYSAGMQEGISTNSGIT